MQSGSIWNMAIDTGSTYRPGAAVRSECGIPVLFAARWAAAALVLCAVSAPAMAQLLPPSVGNTGVQIDAGRVYGNDRPRATGSSVVAGEGFSIGAAITTEYSDNMVRQNEDLPLSPRFESRSDWRFSPVFTMSAGRPLGRQSLFANVVLGRDFYANNTVLNANNFLADAGLNWTAGARCGGRIQGGYEDRGTRFDQFDLVIPSKQKTVNFYASAACQSPVGISPNISYDWSKTTNNVESDDPIIRDFRDFADVKGNGVTGGLTYALAGRGDIGVQGSWRNFSYPNQIDPGSGEASSTRIIALNGVANYRIGPSLRATFGLGHTWVSSKFADDFSGLTWQGLLTYAGPRLGGVAGLSRSVSGSSGGIANYQVETQYNLSASYRANDRISLTSGFSRSEIDSRGNVGLPGLDLQQDFNLNRFFVGGDYRLNRKFSAGLDYSHLNRTSDVPIFSFKANSIVFSLRARL